MTMIHDLYLNEILRPLEADKVLFAQFPIPKKC